MEESLGCSPAPTLTQFLSDCQARVERQLNLHLKNCSSSQALAQAMAYGTLNGGKRLRPVLAYASALAVGGQLQSADPAACAIELIHCYSLVHDDLPAMDDDDLRRGKPTVHKAFDEATAILVGDALQSLAFQILSHPGPGDDCKTLVQTRLDMIAALSQAAGAAGMVGGQALDFEAVGRDLDLDELKTLHRMKTGALVRASVIMGAMAGRHVDTDNDLFSVQNAALSDYAQKIGLAFQVQDDILDEIGDTSTLGKPQGSDRSQHKPTYVSLLGLDQAIDHAQELAKQAISSLEQAVFPGDTEILRLLARYIVDRSH